MSQGRTALDGADRFWTNLAEAADVNRDSQVTRQEFQRATTETMLGTPAGFDETARPWYEAAARVGDANGDGKLTADEFRRVMRALGVTKVVIEEMAASSDSIPVDAVVTATKDFYTSDDPSHPATWSFGKF
ncbi:MULTISPECIES: EF-hand domain-containing protein [unclassified Streptomyces]|uniref:EF-hand domain-containing protein n=1 Tax=unclassified Streptomyces TaxID=2593676 RepID=UPI002E13E980|nr:hypothetical protein OG457_07035 [Streptomyces sp. NBC_01207]